MGLEVILTKNGKDTPFVTKKGDTYFIEGVKYTDDINILLEAIKNVKECDYQTMVGCGHADKNLTKESYWQYSFNYQWNNGGLILWHNPSEMWKDHLTRLGKSFCPTCGRKLIMYYRSYCPKCEEVKPDKKGRINIHEMGYALAIKHNLGERAIIDAICREGNFVQSNDSPVDLYFTGKESIDKYLRLVNEVYPLESTQFYVSW
jgi:hypothetical protein